MNCKKQFPFRVGTTSYIIPDEIIPNIEYLKDKVDDVELVLFESDEISNLPSESDIARLSDIGQKHELTYSIHLPLDVYLCSFDPAIRERSVEKCRRIIELTEVLRPSAYVLHAEAGQGMDVNQFSKEEKTAFSDNFHTSFEKLLSAVSVKASEFCVETLNYPMQLLDKVISSFDLSITLDIGHLELYGYPVQEHLVRYLSRTRVVHMHGIKNGKDHNGLQHMRAETLNLVMQALHENRDQARVFTMEIFSEDDFNTSCAELMKYST
ncbi:cobamide remodeling phosphodiesterase CbiR [Prosthecochloris sp.]|uniref:cobamide remodeling phosphodiesterase CbiR n=1 Tax=Prosthecochloris sp. TaxID=290513 RepID=UPI0025F47B15|nr:cobamide remodeling phosphodiesterase CbiR [Prosthecochloris sp.]